MADLRVVGGEVLTPEGRTRSEVIIRGGRIVSADADVRTTRTAGRDRGADAGGGTAGAGAERATDVSVLDASGLLVAPGFVDLQCNGAVGIDLTTEPERLWEVASVLPRWGVTAWLPTIVTSPAELRERAIAALNEGAGRRAPGAAVAAPLGLHLEGPFLDPDRRGAHAAAHLARPDADGALASHWSRDAGIALVTLAPELPGALDLVRALVGRDVVVSAGHSSATDAQALEAIDAGVSWVTHLFNAMAPLHHRDAGLAGVALTDDRVRVGVIADGLHLHPRVVELVARLLGDRLTLVTDAVAALGLRHGQIRIGDQEALAGADGVRLADGTLAGSDLALDRAVRNLVDFTGGLVGLDSAIAAVTSTPAGVLGLDDRGIVVGGAIGDLVVLDQAGEVVTTVIGGRVAYDRRARPGVTDREDEPWRS